MKYAPLIIVLLTHQKKMLAFDPSLSLVFIIKHDHEKRTFALCTVHRGILPFKPPKKHQAQANALITVSALSVSRAACRACRKATAALGNHLWGTEVPHAGHGPAGARLSCGAERGLEAAPLLSHTQHQPAGLSLLNPGLGISH